MSASVIVVLLGSITAAEPIAAESIAAEPPPTCKPVKHYGVSGCELLPGQTCPPGYHKQAVDPPDPRMKGPSYLMCVPDKPQPKEQPPNTPPKNNR
jgi:hypothetical protein